MVKEFDENIKVIEDFTHCTFSVRKIFNLQVDVYVSSIRKSVGVCDGSVILSKEPMPKQYIQKEQKDFADKRFVAQTEKMRYTWSYDEPYAPERDLAGEALHETDSADTCLLTLIYDPGTADEETQQYRVTRGSYAMFACRTGSNIYYDAALSQEIDYQAGVDTSGESATVYIVPLEENH